MTKQVEAVATNWGPMQAWEGDVITRQLRDFGAHTRNELAMVASLLRPGDRMLDIGAHVGTFALPLARRVGPEGHVFAFEASRDNHALLERNIRLNAMESSITTTFGVVSEEPGAFSMRSPDETNSGMHYFVATAGPTSAELPSVQIDAWHAAAGSPPVALVKIDVEGAEVSVLRSSRRLIERHRPAIYIEINTAALANFGKSAMDIETELSALGYHFFRNVGARNSSHDHFRIARLPRLAAGGGFFDCLAVHPGSARYPGVWLPRLQYMIWRLKVRLRRAWPFRPGI